MGLGVRGLRAFTGWGAGSSSGSDSDSGSGVGSRAGVSSGSVAGAGGSDSDCEYAGVAAGRAGLSIDPLTFLLSALLGCICIGLDAQLAVDGNAGRSRVGLCA
jgi:hypothetical protein